MTMLGMNPASVESLAEELNNLATLVQTAAETCSTALQGLEWEGEDATTFRSGFARVVDSGITAADQVRKMGTRATTEASQQRTTSLS